MITLKKLKIAGGDETPRFEATLCWHGKPAALVSNSGTGGPCRILWVTRPGLPTRHTPRDTIEAVLTEATRIAKERWPVMYEHLPPKPVSRFEAEDVLSTVICDEVEITDAQKRLDRRCKRHTMFRRAGDKAGTCMTAYVAYTPAVAADLRRTEKRLTVILNELPSRERTERLMRDEPDNT